ncbi:hypothetical protein Sjap_018649 [Stephania japonica]|uniref:Protein kinase domain-containing protein n=1 Tax=Stephania japonica TaxID=461633 RepID=A0AAP0NLC4_9MAGN
MGAPLGGSSFPTPYESWRGEEMGSSPPFLRLDGGRTGGRWPSGQPSEAPAQRRRAGRLEGRRGSLEGSLSSPLRLNKGEHRLPPCLVNCLFRRAMPLFELGSNIGSRLHYLHSKNIVHKHVKTDNMLLNKNLTIKLAHDFGIAGHVENSNPEDIIYMAPDVIRLELHLILNGNPYDRKCDIYSYGICLWEIYCCQRPYSNLSFSELTSALLPLLKLLRSVAPMQLVGAIGGQSLLFVE